LIDTNKDGTMTRQEMKENLHLMSTDLAGKEDDVLHFLDIDEDGEVSPCDNEVDIKLIDKDRNGLKSKEEYRRYIGKRCRSRKGR
ncbi:unnamed protein product, partial [Candidula unifasciata]